MGKGQNLRLHLKKIYYDPSHPAGFGSIEKLFSFAKRTYPSLKKSEVLDWLEGEETYTRHRPVRLNFQREKVRNAGIDVQWQADLSDLSSLKKHNDQFTFLLCVIDIFSKFAWVKALKNKNSTSMIRAFDQILKQSKRMPSRLQTDKGTEFLSGKFQTFLRKNKIAFFTTENPEVKAGMVERFQRTLKSRMWKYFYRNKTLRYRDVLDDLVRGYNRAHHRSIQMAPEEVTVANEATVSQRLYREQPSSMMTRKPRLRVGDSVRISKTRHVFTKGYKASWGGELFKIDSVIEFREIPVYRLTDAAGEKIAGTFYEYELTRVNIKGVDSRLWEIERILEEKTVNRTPMVLVKWKHYPSKFNSWIAASQLTKQARR